MKNSHPPKAHLAAAIILALAGTALLLCVLFCAGTAQAAYSLTPDVLQGKTWTYTTLQRFNAGIFVPSGGSQIGGILVLSGDPSAGGTLTIQEGGFDVIGRSSVAGNLLVSGGSVSVEAGQKVRLAGELTDTGFNVNPDTGCVESRKNGALEAQLCGSYYVPPPCGSSPERMPFGGECRSYTDGRMCLMKRTARGLVCQ